MTDLILIPLKNYPAGGFAFLDCYMSANRALAGILRNPVCRALGPDFALDHGAMTLAVEAMNQSQTREGRN